MQKSGERRAADSILIRSSVSAVSVSFRKEAQARSLLSTSLIKRARLAHAFMEQTPVEYLSLFSMLEISSLSFQFFSSKSEIIAASHPE